MIPRWRLTLKKASLAEIPFITFILRVAWWRLVRSARVFLIWVCFETWAIWTENNGILDLGLPDFQTNPFDCGECVRWCEFRGERLDVSFGDWLGRCQANWCVLCRDTSTAELVQLGDTFWSRKTTAWKLWNLHIQLAHPPTICKVQEKAWPSLPSLPTGLPRACPAGRYAADFFRHYSGSRFLGWGIRHKEGRGAALAHQLRAWLQVSEMADTRVFGCGMLCLAIESGNGVYSIIVTL